MDLKLTNSEESVYGGSKSVVVVERGRDGKTLK